MAAGLLDAASAEEQLNCCAAWLYWQPRPTLEVVLATQEQPRANGQWGQPEEGRCVLVNYPAELDG